MPTGSGDTELPAGGREDWSRVADFLDDIEVDDKGMCRWSDVANAQTHIRHTMRAVMRQPSKGHEAALANLREAWAAPAMIRETVETLAPSGAVKAAEHLDGPTFTHEADALVAGIMAIASTLPAPAPHAEVREAWQPVETANADVKDAVQRSMRADYKIGSWLSAALEDPAVCAEMKADINEWFEAHQPGLVMDPQSERGEVR